MCEVCGLKFIDFRKVVSRHQADKRRRGGRRAGKQKGNALLTDIRQHDAEVSRDSTPDGRTSRRRRAAVPQNNVEARRTATRRTASQRDTSPTPLSTPDPEPEAKRRRRKVNLTARAVTSVEQETMAEHDVEEDLQVRSRL